MKRRNLQTLMGLLLLFLLGMGAAQAQIELAREVIGTLGGSETVNNLSLGYTAGETAVTTLKTNIVSGTLTLTQGFEQSDDNMVSNDDPLEVQLDYRLFPNPVAEVLHVSLTTDRPVEWMLAIYDLRGRRTSVPPVPARIHGTFETQFDLSQLPEGHYLLGISNRQGDRLQSFKIRKLN